MDELERIELQAILDFFASAPPSVAEELYLEVPAPPSSPAATAGSASPPPCLGTGRGAQSAILAARVDAARAAGARVLAVETSDRVDGEPGPSFRNVVRAGFEEAYVQQWWVRP